jgi:polyhydroxyalkanoate synthesis regulator phasin
VPLVFQALEELDAVRRALSELTKRFEALEHRVASLESAKA